MHMPDIIIICTGVSIMAKLWPYLSVIDKGKNLMPDSS